jgi:hypothetical protein
MYTASVYYVTTTEVVELDIFCEYETYLEAFNSLVTYFGIYNKRKGARNIEEKSIISIGMYKHVKEEGSEWALPFISSGLDKKCFEFSFTGYKEGIEAQSKKRVKVFSYTVEGNEVKVKVYEETGEVRLISKT